MLCTMFIFKCSFEGLSFYFTLSLTVTVKSVQGLPAILTVMLFVLLWDIQLRVFIIDALNWCCTVYIANPIIYLRTYLLYTLPSQYDHPVYSRLKRPYFLNLYPGNRVNNCNQTIEFDISINHWTQVWYVCKVKISGDLIPLEDICCIENWNWRRRSYNQWTKVLYHKLTMIVWLQNTAFHVWL